MYEVNYIMDTGKNTSTLSFVSVNYLFTSRFRNSVSRCCGYSQHGAGENTYS